MNLGNFFAVCMAGFAALLLGACSHGSRQPQTLEVPPTVLLAPLCNCLPANPLPVPIAPVPSAQAVSPLLAAPAKAATALPIPAVTGADDTVLRLQATIDRQAQQLREVQRKLEQTSERLEALKAIERSIGGNNNNSAGSRNAPARAPAAAPRRPASAAVR